MIGDFEEESEMPTKENDTFDKMCRVFRDKVKRLNAMLMEEGKLPLRDFYGQQPPPMFPMVTKKVPKSASGEVTSKKKIPKYYVGPVLYQGPAYICPPLEKKFLDLNLFQEISYKPVQTYPGSDSTEKVTNCNFLLQIDASGLMDVVVINEYMVIQKRAFESLKKLVLEFAACLKAKKDNPAVAQLPKELLAAFWPAPLQPFVKILGTPDEIDFNINNMKIVRGEN